MDSYYSRNKIIIYNSDDPFGGYGGVDLSTAGGDSFTNHHQPHLQQQQPSRFSTVENPRFSSLENPPSDNHQLLNSSYRTGGGNVNVFHNSMFQPDLEQNYDSYNMFHNNQRSAVPQHQLNQRHSDSFVYGTLPKGTPFRAIASIIIPSICNINFGDFQYCVQITHLFSIKNLICM